MFHFLPSPLSTLVPFVIVLGVLVFFHELGHYLAARWRGVHVEAFSIGFGPPIASWRDRLGTVWKLSWLPLGGYVKLHGQERAEDATPETRATWLPGRTFSAKSPGSRAIVVAAGPVANFVLAFVLFTGLFLVIGRPVGVPVFGGIVPGSAAAQAGLVTGDRVQSIDGAPVTTFEDIQKDVLHRPGQAVTMHILRGTEPRDVTVTLGSRAEGAGQRVGVLGVRGGAVDYVRTTPWQALAAGATQTWVVTRGTIVGVGQMLSGHRNADELSGPLGIAQLSGRVARLGVASLVSFIAVLSINLGLVNLFPIPVLDGGHLMFYAAEALRGRPLPARFQEYGFRAGFALLAGLFIFATWNDLTHLGLFRWVGSLIG